ncbi:hypothetical protein Tco_0786606 [Tanacetum coccineum]
MASLDYRFNLIKECSSCGALYTKSCGCSKGGFVDKFVRDPNKTPDSSQRPPHDCPKCGNPIDGLYCRQCALLRKKLKEVWCTICEENEIFQDFLNTFESSNDNTNVVNVPQEPFVFNQDTGENSSQSPPHIDHHCCYGCGDSLDGIFCQRCTCESCENGAHYGYNCPPKVPTISNPEPCHNQNVDEFPQILLSFHPTCYSGDGSSFTYDSTHNFVDDSPNVFNLPSQPPTYSCEFCGKNAHYGHDCPPQVPFNYNPEPCYNKDFNFLQNFQKTFQAWLQQCQEQVVNLDSYTPEPLQYQKILIYYDDDDDEESSIPLRDIIISGLPPCIAITPVLTTKEPVDSLIMEDEHFDTILATESDEFIKFSTENLVPTLSESEDASDGVCDLPVCDDFPKSHLVTFSNPLFNIDDDCTSSDDESFSEEDVPMENFIFFSNRLFDLDEEIISTKANLIRNKVLESTTSIPPRIDSFDAESNLIESLLNRNTSIDSSSKIDSLLNEFAGELTLLKTIPPGIDDDNHDPEGEIHLVERLLYDNSSPRPPEELNVENSIESFSPSPIPVEDSDSLMEEIDLFLTPDDSIPSGIESDDYDSEGDDNSTSLPEFESFHVDYPDSGDSTIDVVDDIPVLDVPFLHFDCPDFEASRARGFVLRSLELQILSFIMGIQYPNLID